jgi:hypothetical protein
VIDAAGLKASVSIADEHARSISDVMAEIDRQAATLKRLVTTVQDARSESIWERVQLLANDLRRLTAKLAGLRAAP